MHHHCCKPSASAWRLGVLLWRLVYAAWATVSGLLVMLRRRSISTRPASTRQIHEQGVLRALDPDSESETEVVRNPCEADRIGLVLQGKQHALAPEGCQDRAAPEPTRLLESDQQLSDLGGKDTACLCNHHSQLYMLACQGRKCSVVSCYATVKGARNGAPFCKRHLPEASRSPSPKGSRTPNKRPGEGTLSSALRTAAASDPAVVLAFDAAERRVSFDDACVAASAEPAPQTPVRRRSSTPPPSGARAEPDVPGEAQSMEGIVLVRIRPFFGAGIPRPWYIYKGVCHGPAPDGRRNERVRVEVPSLSLALSIPGRVWGLPPRSPNTVYPVGGSSST